MSQKSFRSPQKKSSWSKKKKKAEKKIQHAWSKLKAKWQKWKKETFHQKNIAKWKSMFSFPKKNPARSSRDGKIIVISSAHKKPGGKAPSLKKRPPSSKVSSPNPQELSINFYDYTLFIQEVCTLIIAMGGFIFYETYNDNRFFAGNAFLASFAAIALYVKAHFYVERSKLILKIRAKESFIRQINLNVFLHETTTILLALTVVPYLVPVFKSAFVFEKFTYPSPDWLFTALVLTILLKLALYTKIVYLKVTQKPQVKFHPERVSEVVKDAPWGRIIQTVCTLLIGFMIGSYMYKAGSFFVYAEEHPQHYSPYVFEKKTALIGPIFGKDRYIREEYKYQTYEQIMSDPVAQPYLKKYEILMIICLLLKIIPLFNIFIKNPWISRYLSVSYPHTKGLIAKEISTLLLGFAIGALTLPVFRNAYWYRRSVYPPYGVEFFIMTTFLRGFVGIMYSQMAHYVQNLAPSKHS